jgi:hypothetical protein
MKVVAVVVASVTEMGNRQGMECLQEHLTTSKRYIFLPEDMKKVSCRLVEG